KTAASTVAAGTGGSAGSGAAGAGGVSGEGDDCGCEPETGTGTGTGCAANQKVCAGKCVDVYDPTYGCTQTGCTACATQYPNAQQACLNGACALGFCDTGFKNCDLNDANGCETHVPNDPNNCGACGARCTIPHATASCSGGMCGVAVCDTGWVDCDNDVTNGCEVDLMGDPMNCGACGNQCPPCPDAGIPCQQGSCLLCCAPHYTQCPGDPPNACVTQLGTNQNCNFCGDACALPNATSECTPSTAPPPAPDFTCTLVSCDTGFADCDSNPATGCEANTQTDANNCGTCGNVCPAGPDSTAVCKAGACSIACSPGFADCDTDAS